MLRSVIGGVPDGRFESMIRSFTRVENHEKLGIRHAT